MKRVRATINDIDGKDRFHLFKDVINNYNLAMEHGFYLEATALMESLISDRLESRLGELVKESISFSTIGRLLDRLRPIESDYELKEMMNKQIGNWCGERNKVIHRAAKIELGKQKDWEEFMNDSRLTAEIGKNISYKYDTILRAVRRNLNNQEEKGTISISF